jgi:hypothetical protein
MSPDPSKLLASSVGLILGGEFTGALLDLHHGRFGLAVRKAKAIARVLACRMYPNHG